MSRPRNNSQQKRKQMICCCNSVPKEKIEEAIRDGCQTLPEIFDATTAGVGPCGGSCRPTLQKMLESYLTTGSFPENPRPRKKRRR